MSKTRTFTVLVSTDQGLTWEPYGTEEGKIRQGVPGGLIEATTAPAAIERVRTASPDLKASTSALFYATADFRPRVMVKEMVEKWSLGYADAGHRGPSKPQAELSEAKA